MNRPFKLNPKAKTFVSQQISQIKFFESHHLVGMTSTFLYYIEWLALSYTCRRNRNALHCDKYVRTMEKEFEKYLPSLLKFENFMDVMRRSACVSGCFLLSVLMGTKFEDIDIYTIAGSNSENEDIRHRYYDNCDNDSGDETLMAILNPPVYNSWNVSARIYHETLCGYEFFVPATTRKYKVVSPIPMTNYLTIKDVDGVLVERILIDPKFKTVFAFLDTFIDISICKMKCQMENGKLKLRFDNTNDFIFEKKFTANLTTTRYEKYWRDEYNRSAKKFGYNEQEMQHFLSEKRKIVIEKISNRIKKMQDRGFVYVKSI